MKIAIIGTSTISSSFVNALQQIPNFTLQTVYSRSLKTAQAKQQEWGFKKAVNSIKDLLQSNIDIVYIASPNSLHVKQIIMCLDAKKHVICEKPIALSLKDFSHIYKIADKNQLFLFEAYRHINSPNFNLLQQKLKEIGKIRLVTLNLIQYSSKYNDYKNGIRANVFTKEFAGGALNDLGVYPISLAMALFGNYKDYRCFFVNLEEDVDALGSVILNYGSFLCNISFSKVCSSSNNCEILGEDGQISFSASSVISFLNVNGKTYNEQKENNDMVYEVQNFLQIIQNNNQEKYNKLREISYKTCKLVEELSKC